jgi:AraC family transcriptional regulator, arabinose operon regulatory protein
MEFEQLDSLIPEILLFVDRRCFPEWEIIRQKIDFHDLTFVVEGKSNYYVNDELVMVEAGDILYIPEGSVRQAHTFKDAPMHSYTFNFSLLQPAEGIRLPFETVTKHRISREVLDYLLEFNYVWSGMQPAFRMQARGIFLLILHRLLSISFHQSLKFQSDIRIDRVKDYIISHSSEELDLASVAKVVNLHPVYLGKLFKAGTNCSIKHYINLIRVNNAEMMLTSGGFSVSEAAERCGYKDVSYFSNVFKSIKGYPPSKVILRPE